MTQHFLFHRSRGALALAALLAALLASVMQTGAARAAVPLAEQAAQR